uniref:(northern house mosquito) hypothetical protein n=1 Tax=Culex pipiens TaxID=7175 RepID=A0A8D8CJC0_CULPI
MTSVGFAQRACGLPIQASVHPKVVTDVVNSGEVIGARVNLLVIPRHQIVNYLFSPPQPVLHVVHSIHQLFNRPQQIQIRFGNFPRRRQQLGWTGPAKGLPHRREGALAGGAVQLVLAVPGRADDLAGGSAHLDGFADAFVDVEAGRRDVLVRLANGNGGSRLHDARLARGGVEAQRILLKQRRPQSVLFRFGPLGGTHLDKGLSAALLNHVDPFDGQQLQHGDYHHHHQPSV